MKHKIQTSVIGSYPVPIKTQGIMNDYFSQSTVSWEPFITTAVRDMISAGVDLVSDGQTRDPMIQLFTRKLSGCRIRNRTEVVGKIEYGDSITVEDQKIVRQLIPKTTGIIGILTGPFTLTNSCVDLFYHDEQQLAVDFAKALRKEAEALQKHVDLISIDEPFFSNVMPDYAQELIDAITHHLTCPTRLHVCGDVSALVPRLVSMPVDILSHEFKASPHLFEAFAQHPCSKKICLGSVRSDDTRVEPVDEIVNHINKGLDVFGERIVHIAPDCGQRMLPHDVAYQKLQNLVKAGDIING